MKGLSLQVWSAPGWQAVQHTGAGLVGVPGSPGKSATTLHTWPARQSAEVWHARRQTPEICDHGTGEQTVPVGQGASGSWQAVGAPGDPGMQYPPGAASSQA